MKKIILLLAVGLGTLQPWFSYAETTPTVIPGMVGDKIQSHTWKKEVVLHNLGGYADELRKIRDTANSKTLTPDQKRASINYSIYCLNYYLSVQSMFLVGPAFLLQGMISTALFTSQFLMSEKDFDHAIASMATTALIQIGATADAVSKIRLDKK